VEKLSTNCKRPFLGKENCKSHHIWIKKGHMSPYLDNVLLLVMN
jgi:hypothetical protein